MEWMNKMDIRQLEYFMACAETGSVSEAAKILYSTQPSVSKVLKSLEDSLGIRLFERLPRGIRLTPDGKKFYRRACRIVNEVKALEGMAKHGMTKWIRISLNPSSWFADQFVDFYNENYNQNYHFQIYTAGIRTVMERVRDYLDDVGFVYIPQQQKEDFLYELSRNGLEFIPMHETELMLYPGGKSSLSGGKRDSIKPEELKNFRFIQNYQDEFFNLGQPDEKPQFSWSGLDISVVTNSDYIMERMLKQTDTANISGSYLSEKQKGASRGIPLDMPENKVIFGYIRHKGDTPDDAMEELILFLDKRLHRES